MKSKKLIVTLAALAGVGALFVLWRQFSNPTVNLRPSTAVGEVLADEVSRLLGGSGKVVLISRQPPKDGPDANREKIESFEAAIKRRGTMKLAATDWLPRPPAGTMDTGVVTTGQFLAALDKNPDANAFLVLAGLPPYSQTLVDGLTARSQKLMAVCGYSANVRRWLESKALAVAVVPRFNDLPAGTPAPKTGRDWFQSEFEMITPDSVGRLPY